MEQPAAPTAVDIFDKAGAWAVEKQARVDRAGFYPYFAAIEENLGTKVVIDGREVIMIGSNNYLGLSWDPRVIEASNAATKRYGTSCSGSRFLNGTFKLHEELEDQLADFVGKPAALCFTTGYQTNLGAISAIAGRRDIVISDRLNHASLVDGMLLASGMNRGTKVVRYGHNDMDDLERVLQNTPEDAGKLLVTDGVFSMEGDIAQLPKLGQLARHYGARLYLDEAHAIGVIGPSGRGTQEHWDDYDSADLVMCTFSKSFGAIGGFVAGDAEIIDFIKHDARPLIFSASMPPGTIAAVSAALRIIEEEPEHALRLQEIGTRMVDAFKSLDFNVGPSCTAIVPLIIGDDNLTFLFHRALLENGVYANPVVSPAVPPNGALIRTSYMAIHSDDELDQALEVCATEARKLGII